MEKKHQHQPKTKNSSTPPSLQVSQTRLTEDASYRPVTTLHPHSPSVPISPEIQLISESPPSRIYNHISGRFQRTDRPERNNNNQEYPHLNLLQDDLKLRVAYLESWIISRFLISDACDGHQRVFTPYIGWLVSPVTFRAYYVLGLFQPRRRCYWIQRPMSFTEFLEYETFLLYEKGLSEYCVGFDSGGEI